MMSRALRWLVLILAVFSVELYAQDGSKPQKPPKPPKQRIVRPKSPANRSVSPKKQFMIETGYPKGRPGWVVAYITPLKCGGADIPSNMQWLPVEEAKIKRRAEKHC
jgi:hypothetical protein